MPPAPFHSSPRRGALGPILVTLTSLAACAPGAPVQPGPAPAAHSDQVDALFAELAGPATPGCAVGVVRDGELVHGRGYGSANLDHQVALDTRSVFYLASVSKQFAAAAVALAAEEGYLSLDDDVRKHVPELPEYGAPITVRHLVHHTSGLRDYLTLNSLSGRPSDRSWRTEEFLELVARQRALNFDPGSEYLYSNTGYVLLTEIVRRATGRSMREYADERIYRPLGMRDTHFHDDAGRVVPRRVIGYSAADGNEWRVNHWFAFDLVGDGGLYSTVEDLARWDANFYDGRVGGPGFLGRMHERGVLVGGDTISYAFGLTLGEHRGLRTVEHGGALAGFRTNILRIPDERFSAIVLCNTSAAIPARLARQIAEIHLGDRMSAPPPAADRAATPSAQGEDEDSKAWPVAPAELAGAYYSEELDAVYELVAEGDEVTARLASGQSLAVRPLGSDELAAGSLVLRLRRAGGEVTGFALDAGRVRGIEFVRR